MKMVTEENLVLINALDLCYGTITRVDPRNGKGSTIDLALCNQFLINNVMKMEIDEEELIKPTNYTPTVKKTDHNTIILNVKIDRSPKKKPEPYINLNDEEGRNAFKDYMENIDLDSYLVHSVNNNVQKDYDVINELWNDAVKHSFEIITPKRKRKIGVSKSVREMMREEKWIRENILVNPERGRQIADV